MTRIILEEKKYKKSFEGERFGILKIIASEIIALNLKNYFYDKNLQEIKIQIRRSLLFSKKK